MERLKDDANGTAQLSQTNLHSSMERLKGVAACRRGISFRDLHSSMERLKAYSATADAMVIGKFTFQYGEIKSRLR